MAIIDTSGREGGGIYSQNEEPELEPSVPPVITDIYDCVISIYDALNNNTDQISVGLTLTLLNLYF